MSKAENITKAREHYENRKAGRPIQSWRQAKVLIEGDFIDGFVESPEAPRKGCKGAIPTR